MTRELYSTGFVFKNNNSPYANDLRLSNDFKIKPTVPSLHGTVSPKPDRQSPVRDTNPSCSPKRFQSSSTINYNRDHFGHIGWGVTNPILENDNTRRVLKEQPHKWAYNHDQLRHNFFMETTGNFSEKIDAYLGLPYHMLDKMSMREQRKVVYDRME